MISREDGPFLAQPFRFRVLDGAGGAKGVRAVASGKAVGAADPQGGTGDNTQRAAAGGDESALGHLLTEEVHGGDRSGGGVSLPAHERRRAGSAGWSDRAGRSCRQSARPAAAG